jgi:uncharacterized protein YdaU (DUF1376 family)
MDYYKRYMGDYGRDTSRLSMMEHGAYSLLLDDYYSTRTPLPEDLGELYRICRATTKQEQAAVGSVAKRFFPVGEDRLRHNKRADEEIVKWEAMAEENRERGKLGGRPKKNPDGNPSGNPAGYGQDNPEETRRVSGGLEKAAVSETRRKPFPNPNPNPEPETRSLSHSLHAQNARAGEGDSPNAAGEKAANGHANQPRGDDWDQLQSLKAAYPAGTYDQADWLDAQRSIARRIDDENYTWDQVIGGVKRYAAQQVAKGNIGTQFVKSPKAFFAGITGEHPRFVEPFPLPTAQERKHPEDTGWRPTE